MAINSSEFHNGFSGSPKVGKTQPGSGKAPMKKGGKSKASKKKVGKKYD